MTAPGPGLAYDVPLAANQTQRRDDQRHDLGWPSLLQGDDDVGGVAVG